MPGGKSTDNDGGVLYGIKPSPPTLAVRMALERSVIEFRAQDLLPGMHPVLVRAKGFRGWTVPAIAIGGRRIQGSLAIAQEIDRLAPEVGLFPRDPQQRRDVEAAERFGHDELQPIARRVFRWAAARDNVPRAWMARSVVGTPMPRLAGYALKPVAMLMSGVVSKANPARVRADLQRLPAVLDTIDGFLAAGTIGGPSPNAADLQILTTVRWLMVLDDLRPAIAPRPCGAAALALIPDYPRAGADALPPVPSTLPPAWLPAAPAPAPAGADEVRSAAAASAEP